MGREQNPVALSVEAVVWIIISTVFTCTGLHAQPSLLDRFAGRDLWKRPPAQEELAQMRRLIGNVPKGFMLEPSPWHVWKVDRGGRARYIVLLGEALGIIPGGTSACVQLFDQSSTMVQSWSFQTGWRNELTDATLEYSDELHADLLTLRAAPVINGRDIVAEYFAIGGDKLRLVRLEDSKGAAVQNDYVFPNYEIGVVPSAQTVEDWTGLLRSEDKADVLSALMFLGGRHLDEQERMAFPKPHESKYAALFQELLADASIRGLIAQLGTSRNTWIRDAAILASRGPRQRRLQ